jgi:phosphatidate phosphatase PAH1
MPCIDIIVVKQKDGSLKSSPFFVRFNGVSPLAQEIEMKLNNRTVPLPPDVRMVLRPNENFAIFEKKVSIVESYVSSDSDSEATTPVTPLTPSVFAMQQQMFNNSMNAPEKKHHLFHHHHHHNGDQEQFGNTLQVPGTTGPQSLSNGGHKRTRSWSEKVGHAIKSGFQEGYEFVKNPDRNVKQRMRNRWIKQIDSRRMPDEFTTPPAEILKLLDLSKEVNLVEFSRQGEIVHGRIWIWNHDVRIMVSDIDGTITRSDVRGQIATRKFGLQYAHPGVATLFQTVVEKGYKLLYLSVRSMYQQESTISYIEKLKQGTSGLPQGPVIIPPITGNAIVRWRLPTEFKIPILKRIKELFPDGYQPFIAGWGNRPTDALSYIAVGMKPNRCFIVNKSGKVVTHSLQNENVPKLQFRSYTNVAENINQWDEHPDLKQKVVADMDNITEVQKLTDKIASPHSISTA